MKILFSAIFLAVTYIAAADEPSAQEPVNLKWWIDHFSNKEGTLLVVGDAEIPLEWFLKASPRVKRNIQDWSFTFQPHPNKRVIGVLDENQRFVTWPGAKVFPDGEYPEGFIFLSPNQSGSGPQISVSF
jgi:hypothetical protein